MIDISSLEQYFPNINKPLIFGNHTFTIIFRHEEDTFLINLKIKQQDTKEEHLIKFRFGIGKDKSVVSASHKTDKPHFEIDLYKREKEAFSATVYFTFQNPTDEQLLEYGKGTIVLIGDIIKNFIKIRKLDRAIVDKLIYDKAIIDELGSFEPKLFEALYECYKHSDLIVRQDGEAHVIKTPHNIRKYLGASDLEPLSLPLLELIEKK